MSRTAWSIVLLVGPLVAAGCDTDSTLEPPGPGPAAAIDLDFAMPSVTAEAFTTTLRRPVPADARPAGALSNDSEPPDPEDLPAASIIGPLTKVGFSSGYAYSTGRHSYVGNVGRVETTASVSFNGRTLGTQPAAREEYVPYLLDWGEVKSIWAEAYVFADYGCGLRVTGDSNHRAWWQWFMGGPTPRWGEASATSQAFPPVDQPPCGEEQDDPDGDGSSGGGGGGGSDDGDGTVTCWYWVTYDPYTGVILDAEFLTCDDIEGG